MAKKSINYPLSTNFQLSLKQAERLKEMAAIESCDMAPIIRRAIDSRYEHTVLGIPHCADSARCRCPQFFAPPLLTEERIPYQP